MQSKTNCRIFWTTNILHKFLSLTETYSIINMLRNVARESAINSFFSIYLSPTNLVRTSVLEKLHMRKQSNTRAVPLDVESEDLTQRFSPRFRPSDRFCKLSIRYLSLSSEGEKCRPLDHLWQIPFIDSAQVVSSSNFYPIIQCYSGILLVIRSSVYGDGACWTIAPALFDKHSFKNAD